MTSSAVNNCHGNFIMPIWLALDREIQGLTFIVWYAVEIM